MLSVLIMLSTPLLLKSTCIIIYVKNDKIYISSDTRMMMTQRNKLEKESERKFVDTCKIIKVGKIYYSFAGHLSRNMYAYATAAAKRGLSVKETAEEFGEVMSDHLQKTIERYRSNNMPYYMQQHGASNGLSQIAFFGFENNKPVVKIVEFGLLNKPHEIVEVGHKIYDLSGAKILGMPYASKKYIDSAKLNSQSDDKVIFKIMRGAIKKEMVVSKTVGGNIDQLKLSSKGEYWQPGKSKCH